MRSMSTTGSPRPLAWAAVCCEAKTRLARVLAATLAAKSGARLNIERDQDDAGMDRTEQGDAHSGRFTAQMIARSSWRRPRSWSTRATRGTIRPRSR